jgi:RimJ/RimL family protein N-acetyltransferase
MRPCLTCLPDPVDVTLRTGERVHVRALVPEDRDLVAGAFERLSPRSRHMRFLSPLPRLPKRTLDALMAVDHQRHVALVALRDGRAIGVVRYVRDAADPATADFAISVVDAYQGHGLGRALTQAIAAVAAERGVERFVMDIHPENDVMLGLARSLGARPVYRDGAMQAQIRLAPAPLTRAA